jgi:hypothetical protein
MWPLFSYPYSASIAKKVTSTSGSTNTRGLVYNKSISVQEKAAGQEAKSDRHAFVRNADDTLTEVARETYTTSADGKSATYQLGLLQTATDGTQSLGSALKIDATGFNIGANNLTDKGLSFDTDEGAIYFGEALKWRIKLVNEDLAFEFKQPDGTFVTKTLMTAEE